MRFIGNILWFFIAGILLRGAWLIVGLVWCCTIIGIPWGAQCFKFARLMFAPFGKRVIYGGGIGSFLLNIIWLAVSGLPLAAWSCALGMICCATIVGIPLGLQCFKYAKLALMPFGSEVV